VKKEEDEKPICSHCQSKGHEEENIGNYIWNSRPNGLRIGKVNKRP
jgi:hypothetical protein